MAREMPQRMRDFLCFLAREEQCETAWAHITRCPRCESILFFCGLVAASVGDEDNLPYIPTAIEVLHELMSEEELDRFTREHEGKGE